MARNNATKSLPCPECETPVILNKDGSIPWHMRSEKIPKLAGYLGVPEWQITEKCEAVGRKYPERSIGTVTIPPRD